MPMPTMPPAETSVSRQSAPVTAADLADLERDLRRACKADIDAALQQCAHEARCAEIRRRERETAEMLSAFIRSIATSAVVYAVGFGIYFLFIV